MKRFTSLLWKSLLGMSRFSTILLVGWLVLFISLPLLWHFVGIAVLHQGLELLVLMQVLFVLIALHQAWGWWSVLRTALVIILLSWATYAIILRSGYPLGSLRFSSLLQPQVMGVPWLLPFAWLMMLPPAWAVARLVTYKVSGCLMRPVFTLVSAVAFTVWDTYFDPLMVHWGLWEWNHAGGFYHIPWMNYLAWLIASTLITFAIAPKRLPSGLLVSVYALTWLAGFLSSLFMGLSGPAIIGFLLMGVLLIIAIFNEKLETPSYSEGSLNNSG